MLLEKLTGFQNRVVFDRTGDYMLAFVRKGVGNSLDRRIVRFGAARDQRGPPGRRGRRVTRGDEDPPGRPRGPDRFGHAECDPQIRR